MEWITKYKWQLCFLFVLFTTIVFVFQNIRTIKSQHLFLFYSDPTIPDRILQLTNLDPATTNTYITRLFSNKLLLVMENFFNGVSHSIDPVFLYSINKSTFFNDNGEFAIPVLPVFEFPFFAIAAVTLIRKWNRVKKEYFFLIPMLLASLIVCGIFLPYNDLLKIIPLVITLRFIVFLGCFELIKTIGKK